MKSHLQCRRTRVSEAQQACTVPVGHTAGDMTTGAAYLTTSFSLYNTGSQCSHNFVPQRCADPSETVRLSAISILRSVCCMEPHVNISGCPKSNAITVSRPHCQQTYLKITCTLLERHLRPVTLSCGQKVKLTFHLRLTPR